MVLVKTINITTLKAKASQAIREVRQGATITVLDRDVPVAKIVPIGDDDLIITEPKRKLVWPNVDVKLDIDPLVYLLEDRNAR
jgi:prevent-host-death family protein